MGPLCMNFMILLTLWNSEQKNRLLMRLFCSYPILMKLGKVIVTRHRYYTISPSFVKIGWKKGLHINSLFSIQNFKVSVELWKSYIVRSVLNIINISFFTLNNPPFVLHRHPNPSSVLVQCRFYISNIKPNKVVTLHFIELSNPFPPSTT